MLDILTCTLTRWLAGIGDPALSGGLAALAYGLAGVASIAVLRRLPDASPAARATLRQERALWGMVAGVTILLAVNKGLDLQSLLTRGGRCIAEAGGWYESRRGVQRAFAFGISAGALVLMAMLLFSLRQTLRRTGGALLGLVLICGYVLVRAVTIAHQESNGLVDVLAHSGVFSLSLELAGPVLVIGAAYRVLHATRRTTSRGA